MSVDGVSTFGAPAADYVGPRRALILSGGGMRLSYHAGAVRALLESGLVFEHMDATSGGNLTASMLLSGQSPEEICDRWRELDLRKSLSLRPISDCFKSEGLTALGGTEGMIKKVLPGLGIDIGRINSARGITAVYNILDYRTKQVKLVPHQEIDDEMMVAGMSLPGVLPPLERDGTSYLDAAFVQDANLLECVQRGCEELWLVWGLGNTAEYKGGTLNLYIQMLEMSANGALIIERQRIKEINDRIAKGEAVWGHNKPVRVNIIRPESPLPLDPALYLNQIDSASLIDMGYADACDYLSSGADGALVDPSLTPQKTQRPGITFREMMAGGFALGATDPIEGAKKAAGAELAMHATIMIEDIDRFIADRQHAGRITGRITWPEFGSNIPAKLGVFNLFSPTDDRKLKLMVYELGFAHNGQDYYLAGRKEVRDEKGLDLWSDTTTLYVKLHRGLDTSGEVVGAGVLRLGVTDLAELITTFNATNAGGLAGQAASVTKFASFFLGGLYDSYVRPQKPWWKFW